MNEKLADMALDQIGVDLDNLRNKKEDTLEADRLLRDTNLVPTWHIYIFSGWTTYGEKHLEKDYQTESLRDAIRRAATDFGMMNNRGYPGKIYHGVGGKDHVQKSWDVQGSWSVSQGR